MYFAGRSGDSASARMTTQKLSRTTRPKTKKDLTKHLEDFRPDSKKGYSYEYYVNFYNVCLDKLENELRDRAIKQNAAKQIYRCFSNVEKTRRGLAYGKRPKVSPAYD